MRAFVDREGRLSWGAPSGQIGRPPGVTSQMYAEYLVVNAGTVEIHLGIGSLKLRWRPRFVTDAAFAGTLYLLADYASERVIVESHNGHRWQSAVVSGTISTLSAHLQTQLDAERPRVTSHSIFTEKLDPVSVDQTDYFGILLRHWRQNGIIPAAPGGIESIARVIDTSLGGRYVWMKRRPGDVIRLDRIGDGFNQSVRDVLLPAVGQSIAFIQDRRFGRFCLESYAKAACSNTPVLQNVDAMIRPRTSRPVRRRYRRLILPFQGLSGVTLLLGCSIEDHSIDLRRTAA